MDAPPSFKSKIVVVGDSQCGKTALLNVFAKDTFPAGYIPTVFENYTADFKIERQRVELRLWDTSVMPRPTCFQRSEAPAQRSNKQEECSNTAQCQPPGLTFLRVTLLVAPVLLAGRAAG
ncbi:hypothetical protein CRUP_037746 [Coryphaenoides rupestris]|nr:hypothetical protein CRUP_037746 [Coryphaenoides rupestris]